jgi:hypothetical protein
MSESSEDKSEELAQARNDEMAASGETLHSGSRVVNTMSEGEQRALHNRIESLEHELKVQFEQRPRPELRELPLSEKYVFYYHQQFCRRQLLQCCVRA